MSKVIHIPLDERPCNLQYPQALANMTDMEMVVPGRELLGEMKKPAKVTLLHNWLKDEAKQADYLIVSIDMLIYGGIVPSRLHTLTLQDCLKSLEIIQEIKRVNPSLKVFAYNLIMRVPAYSSSEEEPDYYEQYGEYIYRLGWLTDKKEQNLADNEELEEYTKILEMLPEEVKWDYFERRKVNHSVTSQILQMVDSELIDYLIIPLDDNSEYGFTAKEQRQLMLEVDRKNLLDRIAIYPGADEIACTLFARVFCESHSYTPEIALRYSSTKGPFIIPRYEDRSLSESIKSHITAAGGVIVRDENQNNVLLMVHSPAEGQKYMAESSFAMEKRHRSYFSEVNIREFVQAMKHQLGKGINVALADVAICNGGDHSLLQLLQKQGILGDLLAYAGWNTNGNTMGTVVAHAIIASYYKGEETLPYHEKASRTFFYSRLVEDWGYQSVVRKYVSYEVLPTMGLTPRYLGGHLEEVTELVNRKMEGFIEKYLFDLNEGSIQINDVHLPWKRMFEVGFTLFLNEKMEKVEKSL